MNTKIYFPVEITFRNLPHSGAIESKATQLVESKLATFFDHIMHCQVVIESHHRHHQGNIYHVSITLHVPNSQLVVNRDPAQHQAHEDLYVALRDAFNAMKKQLQAYAERQHDK